MVRMFNFYVRDLLSFFVRSLTYREIESALDRYFAIETAVITLVRVFCLLY